MAEAAGALASVQAVEAKPPLSPPCSLVGYALAVLETSSHVGKAQLTREALARWRAGNLPTFLDNDSFPPDRPARDPSIQLCEPGLAPKRGKGGSLASRIALLHSLAHIESWAVDLSWDIVARFGRSEGMPRSFFDDWAVVAEDEARHFEALAERLLAVGSHYGSLPAHDGLWESATATAGSLAARLAVEHCTHEARGLDVLPQTIARFRAGGDEESASLMESVIYPEEVTHCAKGVTWFRYLHQRTVDRGADRDPPMTAADGGGGAATACATGMSRLELDAEEGGRSSAAVSVSANGNGIDDDDAAVAAAFHEVVRKHFHGTLKPPFNDEARGRAGFKPSWYLPLVTHRSGAAATTQQHVKTCRQGSGDSGVISCVDGGGSGAAAAAAAVQAS